MRWAFVPPKPKPEIATRRADSGRFGHGTGSFGIVRLVDSIPKSAGGSLNWCCGGITSFCSPRIPSITETDPAAQPVWPISDLFEVTRTGLSPVYVCRRFVNSARSPAGVPVACAMIQSIPAESPSVAARARSTAIACPSELGA